VCVCNWVKIHAHVYTHTHTHTQLIALHVGYNEYNELQCRMLYCVNGFYYCSQLLVLYFISYRCVRACVCVCVIMRMCEWFKRSCVIRHSIILPRTLTHTTL
jgi:hypothetical protein